MSEFRINSHLTVSQQQAKPYEYKKPCLFCYVRYDRDLSDAFDPDQWCSLKCQTEDEWIEANGG